MIYGILLAAGLGSRFGGNKLLAPLGEKKVWEWSLALLRDHKMLDEVLVVGGKALSPPAGVRMIEGGVTRFDSFTAAARFLLPILRAGDLVLVHNAANPFATKKEIARVLRAAREHGAAAVAGSVVDTIKSVTTDRRVKATLPRGSLRATQTPQALRADVLRSGLIAAARCSTTVTDEMMLAEKAGFRPVLVPKSAANFKITTADDLLLARLKIGDLPLNYLCGLGSDSHAFSATAKGLTLGGLFLPAEPKFAANSDGDVILHALTNAILSALGEGSLAEFADPLCRSGVTDSAVYLGVALERMKKRRFQVGNASIALECARPLIAPLAESLRSSLSRLLAIAPDKIGITATSGEGLTAFGRGEGVFCQAVVSLYSSHRC